MKQKKLFFAWYFVAVLLLLVTLFHYHLVYLVSFTIGDFFAHPAQYAGINKSLTGPYGGPADGGFYLIYNQRAARIYYDQQYTPPRLGEVNLYGELQADGSLRALRVHNYNYNYVLYVLSFFAGLGTLIFFFHEWKITRKGFKHA